MTDEEREYEREWHLDKKVPIALIFTIAMQTGVFIWWAASLTGRVERLELDNMARSPQAERITRLETQINFVVQGIEEIKHLIRNQEPRR